MGNKKITPEIFWANVTKHANGCWTYNAVPLKKTGYTLAGKAQLAHRYAYQIAKGPIPRGMQVCHTCDFRSCVNPDHLWLGTAKDNRQDCLKKGRHNLPSGNAHWSRRMPWRMAGGEHMSRKLTWAQVREMRSLFAAGVTQKELATRFGVAYSTISPIVRGKSWRETAMEEAA